jgi:hypothetical protein
VPFRENPAVRSPTRQNRFHVHSMQHTNRSPNAQYVRLIRLIASSGIYGESAI